MQTTHREMNLRKIAFYILAFLALAAILLRGLLEVVFFAVLLIVLCAALLRGLLRGVKEINAARSAGNADAVARCRGPFRLYEAGCLVLLLILIGVCVLPLIVPQRVSVKQSRSVNNVKNLSMAFQTYSSDYNDTFPGWVKNPDGAYVHNTWDQQIDSQIKSKEIFSNWDNGIRSYSDPRRERVLTYGLNGLLITPAKAAFDGNGGFDCVNAKNPPPALRPSDLADPAHTILLAELATQRRFPGIYGQKPSPVPSTANPNAPGSGTWEAAWDGWIDVSPRAWVENGGPTGSYYVSYADHATEYGVMRLNYRQLPMTCFAFADGHVEVMRLSHTVGLGTTTAKGLRITVYNCWSRENTNNMWIPR